MIEKRKREAIEFKAKFKQPTEEEITAANESIPEWKRFSLVVLDENPEKLSIFARSRQNLLNRMKQTSAYESYLESDLHKEVVQFKEDYEEAKRNLTDEINNSQVPFIVASRDIAVDL